MSNEKIVEAYAEALESADVIPMTSEELFRLGYQAALSQQPESEPVAFAKDGNLFWHGDPTEKRGVNCDLFASPQPSAQVPRGWRITEEGGGIRIDTPSDNHCILERLEGAPGYLPINMLYDLCEAMLAAPSIAEKRGPIAFAEMLPLKSDLDYKGNLQAWNGRKWDLWDWPAILEFDEWGLTHWMPTGLVRPEPPEVP